MGRQCPNLQALHTLTNLCAAAPILILYRFLDKSLSLSKGCSYSRLICHPSLLCRVPSLSASSGNFCHSHFISLLSSVFSISLLSWIPPCSPCCPQLKANKQNSSLIKHSLDPASPLNYCALTAKPLEVDATSRLYFPSSHSPFNPFHLGFHTQPVHGNCSSKSHQCLQHLGLPSC